LRAADQSTNLRNGGREAAQPHPTRRRADSPGTYGSLTRHSQASPFQKSIFKTKAESLAHQYFYLTINHFESPASKRSARMAAADSEKDLPDLALIA
jgi:hypothetical protein